MNSIVRIARIVIAVVAIAGPASAQQQTPADWIEPFQPFRIADNLYYERTFAVLKSLPCDIPLGAHGSYFDLDVKYHKASAGDATAFIDPDGYTKNVASAEKDFLTELARQRALQAR